MDNEDNVSDALLDNCQDHMREHTFESDEMQMATFAAGDVPGNPVKTEPSYSSGKRMVHGCCVLECFACVCI
jgi:hypothetical protein